MDAFENGICVKFFWFASLLLSFINAFNSERETK